MRSVTTRVAGLIILVAGIWGGLIPFIGPYFHFTLGPDHTWTWTSARFYLDALPAIAAIVGGLVLVVSGRWLVGGIGALLALAGGIWFAIGPDVSRLWHSGGAQGVAHGPGGRRVLEHLTLHTGLGVLIAGCAAFALPGVLRARRRVSAVEAGVAAPAPPASEPAGAVDGEPAAAGEEAAEPEPVGAPERG
jgi:hypothetical protein